MTETEREKALVRMNQAIVRFHSEAVQIGCKPFTEFAGLMQAYLQLCQKAHAAGHDFSSVTQGAGAQVFDVGHHEAQYLEVKMQQIFGSRTMMASTSKGHNHQDGRGAAKT